MKKLLKAILILVLAVIVAVGGLLGWLSATEFKPAPVEMAEQVSNAPPKAIEEGAALEILSWNIGYGGLGAGSDFFMDGGENARAADEPTVKQYLDGIRGVIDGPYDLVMLQEVDTDSARTYGVSESALLCAGNCYFAYNYSCPWVPNPNTLIIDPLGKVNSGLLTNASFTVDKAERISLPCPFSWPLRIANLKRCLLVTYLPIEGSDKQLVLVNLHLEAYDDGEGKLAQTAQLRDFILSEYEKGNYVIAGGDFNQAFPGSLEVYPNTHPELWEVGALDDGMLPGEGWRYVFDLATPSCRLLNQPYDPSDTVNTQYYVIDGFILSPNVELRAVETLPLDFADSDHNPVHLSVVLR